MADMTVDKVLRMENVTVLAGERLRVQVLNSDGSEKTLVCDDTVPTGKTFSGVAGYNGTASAA